jgi:hypothetical protein
MKPTKELTDYEAQTRRQWMIWPAVIVIVVAMGITFIDAIAIDDKNGKGEGHIGPIPAGVTELSKDSYLIASGASSTPHDICKGETTGGEGPSETRHIPSLKGTYVECYVDQEWGFKPDRDDPNLGQSIVRAVSKQEIQIPTAAALGLALIYPLLVLFANAIGAVKSRRNSEKIYNAQLARYRAIQASYARSEIDDLQFDAKIQGLVQEGFELPDPGIFKKG